MQQAQSALPPGLWRRRRSFHRTDGQLSLGTWSFNLIGEGLPLGTPVCGFAGHWCRFYRDLASRAVDCAAARILLP